MNLLASGYLAACIGYFGPSLGDAWLHLICRGRPAPIWAKVAYPLTGLIFLWLLKLIVIALLIAWWQS